MSIKVHGRADATVNLFKIVENAKKHISKFGGHEFAIGVSLKEEELENFKTCIYSQEIAKKAKEIYYDMIMPFEMLSIELIESFDILEPFGKDNEKPVFLFKNVKIVEIYRKEKVVQVLLTQKDKKFYALTFDIKLLDGFNKNDDIYMLASLNINEYMNKKNIQLQIIDLKKV